MSLLDLSLLGLLADQPLHGYELSKRLRDQGRGAVSYGALYPALGRLDRKGLITSVAAAEQVTTAAPMTGSLGAEVARLRRGVTSPAGRSKRKRKVYTITDGGRRRLHELLTAPADDDRAFAAQLAAAGHLAPHERLELFGHRRRMLRERLGEEAPHLLDRYRTALRERDRLADEAEIEWLEHLIAAEHADTSSVRSAALVGAPADTDPSVDSPVDVTPRTVGGSQP
ncbi:MAG TPA: PadR family transcriptional regulator [Acidimicrobiales bacterium]|nr:PadR family transcriptional regulator [Acidimicrobiales bacterium]